MPVKTRSPLQLSTIAQQVAECYAVLYPARPARSKTMQWLNSARKATTGERGIKSNEMRDAVEELVAAGLLQASIEGKRGTAAEGPAAMPGTITRFCEAAHLRGVAAKILKEFDNDTNRYSYQSAYILPTSLEQKVRGALIADQFKIFKDKDLPADIWIWLTEPRAKPYLQRLPIDTRQKACAFGLSFLIRTLQPVSVFASTCESVAPSAANRLLVATAHIFQGDFKQAETLIKQLQCEEVDDKRTNVECQATLALIATLRGDDAGAQQAIAAALDIERSGTRKRYVYPDSLCFSIATLSLLRIGTPEAMAQFKSLMAARKKLKLESDLDTLFIVAEIADQPNTDAGTMYLPGSPSIMSVLYAIASRWHKDFHIPGDHAGYRWWLEQLIRQAHASSYLWALAELQTVAETTVADPELFNDDIQKLLAASTAEARCKKLGMQSLTLLITTLEPWEYSLRELEQLAVKPTARKAQGKTRQEDKPRRLIWQLHGSQAGKIWLTPLEQTQGKGGQWSAGRRVALKRLLEQASDMPHLLEQDRNASRTIHKLPSYRWGNGSPSYETSQRTAYQLVGHPHVFDQQGQPIDVIDRPPELRLTEKNGLLQLSLQPKYQPNHYYNELDSPNRRLNVTRFTAAQSHISDALPNGSVQMPAAAKDRLQNLLSTLSADISVQGDTNAAASAVQPGDPKPLLAMEQFGMSLRVRIRAEPLPESGVYFDAGVGGSIVYVQTQTGSVSVQRDLAKEQSLAHDMVMQSVILSSYFDGRSHFILDNTYDALELLEEVQEAGIRCIWLGEQSFRIKARVDIGNVNISIKSSKEWFSASGSLSLDDEEKESVAVERLLELMANQPGSRFVELGTGEFLVLSTTLQQQLNTLQAFRRPAKSPQDTAKIHPMALLALDPLLENAQITGDKAWQKLRQRVTEAFTKIPPLPTTLNAELRPYQLEGFHWLARLGQIGAGACLADDMGLGKTVQTLAVLLSRAKNGPALVVAPTSVAGNWLQEAQRFAPTLNVLSYADTSDTRQQLLESLQPFDMVVISYGLMLNDIEHLEKVHWHTIVLDEAQAIKNAKTRRAKAAKQLNADFRVVTTGTPVQNNLMDLHSLFGFLNPQLLGSDAAFRKRFALPITHDADAHAREQLQLIVSPFLLRRHKREVLKELPARTEVTLEVKLSKEEALLYETLRLEALESLKQRSEKNNTAQQKMVVLSYLTKLRRLCCNPSLVSPHWSGPESKLDVFASTLAELIASNHKALVFSQFVDHLKIVERHLKKQDVSYQYLDGSTPAKQRTQRVNAFQAGEGDVFLISLTAGGTGLNLTAADYVIHLDPWWNPAVEDQASDRAHRLGQQRPVTIYRMVTTGTIEEQIQALHRTKRELADSVLSGAEISTVNADMMMQLLQRQLV